MYGILQNHSASTITANTNQPTKGLTKGGELREAQVDVPRSIEPFLRKRNAGLGNKHLNYNGVVLMLTISVAFNLRRLRTRIPRLHGKSSYSRAKLWLEGLLGFEPRVVELTLTEDYIAYMRSASRDPTLRYTQAFALQLGKITENLSQGSRNNGSDPTSTLLGGAGRSLVSANVCRAAELAGFPHQPTWIRTFQLEI